MLIGHARALNRNPTYGTIKTGQVTCGASAVPLSATSDKYEMILISLSGGSEQFYYGGPGVTPATGVAIFAPERRLIPVNDLADLYVVGMGSGAPAVVAWEGYR